MPTRQYHGDTNKARRHKGRREQCLGNLFKRGGRREQRVAEVDGHTAGCTTRRDVHMNSQIDQTPTLDKRATWCRESGFHSDETWTGSVEPPSGKDGLM